MKILHTSDWHLGRSLYGEKRYDEFEQFLHWLTETIEAEQIDVLLVAGDIFDSGTPSNRAQKLYYQFLTTVAASACRHIVITAGNHDSPSFLNAPKELLEAINVHLVASISDNVEDEVVTLDDDDGKPALIVCAVPYLRDRDIRTAEAGESSDDKHTKLIAGIKNHYKKVFEVAQRRQKEMVVPVVAMGHLFTTDSKRVEGDGVRDLYVGTLAYIGSDTFPDFVDYTALGHLHVPQKVGNSDTIRYCGSPIPIGFGEAKQKKMVITVDFSETIQVAEVDVPQFQRLEQIKGSIEEIESRLVQLKDENSNAWLEVEYTGDDVVASLRSQIESAVDGTLLKVLRIKNRQLSDVVMGRVDSAETLDNISVDAVFERVLDAKSVPNEQRTELQNSYKEIVQLLAEEDRNAE